MKIDLTTGFILMGAIISAGAIGMCAFAIWLYHKDGGTRSTKIIFRDALTVYFAPLTSIWKWMGR